MKNDIIILGGGLAGVTTLYELTRRGHKATLIEENSEVGLETSFANGGMLTPSMSDPWNKPGVGKQLITSFFDPYSAMKLRIKALPSLYNWGIKFLYNSSTYRHRQSTISSFKLAKFSVKYIKHMQNELELDIDSSNNGTMKVFRTENGITKPLEIAEMLKPYGLVYEVLSSSEIIEVEPQLAYSKDKLFGAIYYPDDGAGDARMFTVAIANKAIEMGAKIQTGVRIEKILSNGKEIIGLKTKDKTIDASRLVVTAGNHSPSLLLPLGLIINIKPVKGYSLTFSTKGTNQLPKIPVIDDSMHTAIVPLGQRLRAVGTAEFSGFDKSIPKERIKNLRNLFENLYPNLASEVKWEESIPWAGLRPMSADGLPLIGSTRIKGLWLNTGHGHLGWTMSAGAAKIIVDIMLKEKTSIDSSPFRVDRESI